MMLGGQQEDRAAKSLEWYPAPEQEQEQEQEQEHPEPVIFCHRQT
jgi:hypothetical protein